MDTPRRIQTGMTTHALVTLQHSPRKEPVPAWPLRVMNYSKSNIVALSGLYNYCMRYLPLDAAGRYIRASCVSSASLARRRSRIPYPSMPAQRSK